MFLNFTSEYEVESGENPFEFIIWLGVSLSVSALISCLCCVGCFRFFKPDIFEKQIKTKPLRFNSVEERIFGNMKNSSAITPPAETNGINIILPNEAKSFPMRLDIDLQSSDETMRFPRLKMSTEDRQLHRTRTFTFTENEAETRYREKLKETFEARATPQSKMIRRQLESAKTVHADDLKEEEMSRNSRKMVDPFPKSTSHKSISIKKSYPRLSFLDIVSPQSDHHNGMTSNKLPSPIYEGKILSLEFVSQSFDDGSYIDF